MVVEVAIERTGRDSGGERDGGKATIKETTISERPSNAFAPSYFPLTGGFGIPYSGVFILATDQEGRFVSGKEFIKPRQGNRN